ncbi:hypothetical protein LK996_09985 [Lysobacter sp. A6]|uniref:Glycerophosphoryl diester phosphodiesterase membrane domain-containing protein n=1 Tax=Noviluteimonas lactosilytica TaxID=2888523 RepID=A0ABS8JIK0_9GAMM|nr:hypothetical protein [Lysobacter lactosilyticus]MCC8363401.1 hypothetical protein [Lysobacter lactosilyticus]
MATRMTSPLAGFGWLRNAVNVGARKPGTLLLAALLLFLVSMIPSLITMPIQLGMPGDMMAFVGAMVIAFIAGLALSPVLAGFLQVVDAIERGQPVRARDVFAAYRNGVAMPSIVFGLVMMVLYVVVIAVAILTAATGIGDFFLSRFTDGAIAAPQLEPEVVQAGMWRMVGTMFALMLPVSGIWAIGFGQIAIGRRGVGEALVDGVTGAFKNLVPMLILALAITVGGIVLVLLFGLVLIVLGAIASFVHEYVAFAVIVPLYFAFAMAVYVVSFALAYFFWRDVCAADAGPDLATAEV